MRQLVISMVSFLCAIAMALSVATGPTQARPPAGPNPYAMQLPASLFSPWHIITSRVADNTFADSSPFGSSDHPREYRSIPRVTGYYVRASGKHPSYDIRVLYLTSMFLNTGGTAAGYASINRINFEPHKNFTQTAYSCAASLGVRQCTVLDGHYRASDYRQDSEYWMYQDRNCVIEAEAFARLKTWTNKRAMALQVLHRVVLALKVRADRAC